ncbi:MAG: cold-shock protein [Cyclobacteriaceae bacterium]|nr:cold-shock protein [Cyclobacteriaceae bacterium]
MAKSNNAFIKKQKEEVRRKKRLEKEEKREERKKNSKGGALEDMIMYVDEFGNFTSEPPKNFPQGNQLKQ